MTTIGTYIVLSTGHLTEKASAMLSEMGEDVDYAREFGDWRDSNKGLVRCGYGYGHWVRVPHLDENDPDDTLEKRLSQLPDSLANCLRHAAQFGARWVLFDRDEPETSGLEHHEW